LLNREAIPCIVVTAQQLGHPLDARCRDLVLEERNQCERVLPPKLCF